MPSQREGPSGGDDDADAEKKPGSGLDLDALFAAPAENDAGAPPRADDDGWGDLDDDTVMQAQLERAAEEAAAAAAEKRAQEEAEGKAKEEGEAKAKVAEVDPEAEPPPLM